jgi:hypothetical protein
MPITIRDEALEERIRALAKRTGETPGALIARLFRPDEERLEAEEKALKEQSGAPMKCLPPE